MKPRRITFSRTGLPLALAGALLSGCASSHFNPDLATPHAPPAPVRGAQAGLSATERLDLAVAFLEHGRRERARTELKAILVASPNDAPATRLLAELDEDPRAALGEQNFAYTVRPGETFEMIASRFLGDRLKFYLLARYNGIEAPGEVVAGRVLMIPGVMHKPAPPHGAAAPQTIAPPAATSTPAAAPPSDPRRARALRMAALESLNRGQVGRSVGLLQQASALDPDNAVIKRDLARAQRLEAGVRR